MAPSQEALRGTEIHLPNVQRQTGSVSKMTVTGIRAAGIRSCISFLELDPACMRVRVRVCAHVRVRVCACMLSHTCRRVQSRTHLPEHLVVLSLIVE